MKIMRMVVAAAVLLVTAGAARAQQIGGLGIGVVAGNPTGLAIKSWFNETQAFDAGAGFSGNAAFYADFLWHSWNILPQPDKGRLGTYVGAGPRIEASRDAAFAIRTIAGMTYWISDHPIELFLEAGPVFRLTQDRGVGVDAGLGIRFYVGGPKKKK